MNSIEVAYRKYSRRRFPLPSEAEVRDFELVISADLPQEYRQYLLMYNGGYFTEPSISLPWCVDGLDVMYGIQATDASADLSLNIDIFDNNIPLTILPIGYTVMGALLYMCTHHDDYGTIGAKKAHCDEYTVLASSIGEFFDLLK